MVSYSEIGNIFQDDGTTENYGKIIQVMNGQCVNNRGYKKI